MCTVYSVGHSGKCNTSAHATHLVLPIPVFQLPISPQHCQQWMKPSVFDLANAGRVLSS